MCYVIYIDPKTNLMKRVEYIVTYGAMLDLFRLPPDVKSRVARAEWK